MKSIAWVNITIPSDDNNIDYDDDQSLNDYDIVVFNPELPHCRRIEFSGGGSCITIEETKRLRKAILHWTREIKDAVTAGKTVFIVLNYRQIDQGATNSTIKAKGQLNYTTSTIDSYSPIPEHLLLRNAKGRRIVIKDSRFRGIYDAIQEILEYRVVLQTPNNLQTIFATKDGAPIGGLSETSEFPGRIVFLPYFDFDVESLLNNSGSGETGWNAKAHHIFHSFVAQLISADRFLNDSGNSTPPPDWLANFPKPKAITEMEEAVTSIDAQIEELNQKKSERLLQIDQLSIYARLLYENGKSLEYAIEKTLQLLNYTVETIRIGDLEIDHVIVGPSGKRMIGESEGKDTSAIDITKFRQLESNIGEDFEREEINEPAKGILFGNGFRLSDPANRSVQFTQKSLTNARRLGSALVRTSDLYTVALHILNNPDDETYKAACRDAIENTAGGMVVFPDPLLTKPARQR